MRLFIAIALPDEIKRQLALYARALTATTRRARLTREENFHITMAFLGDALSEEQARAAMDEVTGAPFKLYSDKPGCFKRGNSEIHWLGLKESPELAALYARLSAALAGEGFICENRPFTPHITLAREVAGPVASAPPPRFIVPAGALTLMESTRRDNVLAYLPRYQKCL